MLNSSENEFDDLGLKYRLYQPDSNNLANSKKCLLLVHGRAGNSKVMWIFTKALGQSRCLVIAPQAHLEDEIGGHSWWEIGKNKDKSGDLLIDDSYLKDSVDRLEAFVNNLKQKHGIEQITAFGFSQGAGLISSLAVRNPGIFSGVAMLSGFLPSPARYQLEQTKVNLPAIFMFHGSNDQIISFTRASADRDVLLNYSKQLNFVEDEVGHKVSSKGIKELQNWYAKNC